MRTFQNQNAIAIGSIAAAFFSLCLASPAAATIVTARLTVDNLYGYYISTSDAALGAFVGDDGPFGWGTVETYNNRLVPGVRQFLHIIGQDQGPPAMFLGDFTLSDSNFEFSNGSQLLLTGSTDWGVSLAGFGRSYDSPDDLGPNGTAPWGMLLASPSAHYIWAPSLDPNDPHYFSAVILPIALDGDYNKNGTVDAADYVTWRRGLGTTYTEADYDVWRLNFGEVLNSGLAADSSPQVPEPSIAMLLSGALAFIALRRTTAHPSH